MQLTSQPITVSTASQNTFAAHVSKQFRNAKTARLAMQHVGVFRLWYEAKFNQAFEPSLLTNYDFHLYREWSLKQEKVKASTWNSRLWALGILCEWIGDPDLLQGVEQQGQVRGSTKHRSLTDNEYHRLVHQLEQNLKRTVTAFEYQNAVRDWASVMLMLHGLRVEECSLVEVGDITINERSGFALVRNGKGSKERTVPLNLIARKALSTWLTIRAERDSSAPNGHSLFKTTVRTLQRSVESLGKQIGVPDLTPHWLRYTFAKRLERNGQALETIRDLLGHESIETTRRYLRSSLDELTSAVEGVM
jgi:Site-specific recombinase XerD